MRKPVRKAPPRKFDIIEALVLDDPGLREAQAGLGFRLDLKNLPASLGRADCLPPSRSVPLEAYDLRELLKLAVGENERADEAEDVVDLYIESVNEIHRLVVQYEAAHGPELQKDKDLKGLLDALKSECASIKAPASQPVAAGR